MTLTSAPATGSAAPYGADPAALHNTSDTPRQADVRTLGAANAPDPRLPGRVVLLQADAGALPLPDESVDLVVTSPPYWAQRSYTDGGQHYTGQIGDEPSPLEYLDRLVACTVEWARVLKPGGSIGTAALVAAALGRIGISVDRSADYTDVIARWRTNDPAQIARALAVPTPAAAPAGQDDLFNGMLP